MKKKGGKGGGKKSRPKPPKQVLANDQERAWWYVGRFLRRFASIESWANHLFLELFGLYRFDAVCLFCTGSLDLRKKLKLIELGLEYQEDFGVDQKTINGYKKTLDRVHKLADIRNAIAHSVFDGYEDGIDFDYVNSAGRVQLPHKPRDKEGPADTLMTYKELDEFDVEARKLVDAINKIIDSLVPIKKISGDFARDIANIIASSENVIVFPGATHKKEKQ